jgi:hypothetical protein
MVLVRVRVRVRVKVRVRVMAIVRVGLFRRRMFLLLLQQFPHTLSSTSRR